MAENVEEMDSNCRKKRLKELLDMGGQIRLTKDTEDNVLTINKISNIIKETDAINKHGDVKERATNTTEVVMDAQVIQMGHELIGEVLEKIGNTEFSDEQWIHAIIGLVYKNDNEEWNRLTNLTAKIIKTAKCSSSLLGGFDLEQDVTQNIAKERQKRSKTNKADELMPENLSQLENQDKNTQSVNLIYRQIIKHFIANNQRPIPFYKLVINPNNYMKTVDNVFKIAFLARDKSVAIELGDNDLPNVRPLSKQDKANASSETVQDICSISPRIIRDMIEKYQIDEAMLN